MAEKKKWIGAMNGGAGPQKGALHKMLDVPTDQTIPKGKIKAAAGKGGLLGKRAQLAETLEGLSGSQSGEKEVAKEKKEQPKSSNEPKGKQAGKKTADTKGASKGMQSFGSKPKFKMM